MAKLKILTSMVGTEETREVGDVVDVSEEEAARLVAAGFAEPVKGAKRGPKPKDTASE